MPAIVFNLLASDLGTGGQGDILDRMPIWPDESSERPLVLAKHRLAAAHDDADDGGAELSEHHNREHKPRSGPDGQITRALRWKDDDPRSSSR
ncbi:hypothetical protein P8C59_005564 [Phyllachora maydis]|uniref:Uncharacterized protein n=1 Tax=Phyllachora maydis TaxID=1825666 RepID=A0AAD9MBK4_9PEZI|nr:hypothetical protein P8C59_005564 [Phyllachora maydis]